MVDLILVEFELGHRQKNKKIKIVNCDSCGNRSVELKDK